VAVKGARLWGVPAGVIVGGSDILILPRSPARRRAVVAALSAADAVFAVGRALCEATVALGIDPDKVHLHRQGIDPRFRPADRAAARRRLGLPLDTDILLWVGRMVPVKGLDVLIDACARLRKSGREFRLVLAGDGPLRSAVAADCERRHLTRLVLFVGPQPHDALPDWYRAADLCVLSSYSEGVPNVLRESLACGTPYVATAVGGVAEITDDPAVRLVPPNDPAALASAIDRALSERLAPVADSARFPDWCEAAERMIEVLMTRRCQSSEPSYQLEPCA
jgi:glycosyltransferase involved in cell wall biosynthesis